MSDLQQTGGGGLALQNALSIVTPMLGIEIGGLFIKPVLIVHIF